MVNFIDFELPKTKLIPEINEFVNIKGKKNSWGKVVSVGATASRVRLMKPSPDILLTPIVEIPNTDIIRRDGEGRSLHSMWAYPDYDMVLMTFSGPDNSFYLRIYDYIHGHIKPSYTEIPVTPMNSWYPATPFLFVSETSYINLSTSNKEIPYLQTDDGLTMHPEETIVFASVTIGPLVHVMTYNNIVLRCFTVSTEQCILSWEHKFANDRNSEPCLLINDDFEPRVIIATLREILSYDIITGKLCDKIEYLAPTPCYKSDRCPNMVNFSRDSFYSDGYVTVFYDQDFTLECDRLWRSECNYWILFQKTNLEEFISKTEERLKRKLDRLKEIYGFDYKVDRAALVRSIESSPVFWETHWTHHEDGFLAFYQQVGRQTHLLAKVFIHQKDNKFSFECYLPDGRRSIFSQSNSTMEEWESHLKDSCEKVIFCAYLSKQWFGLYEFNIWRLAWNTDFVTWIGLDDSLESLDSYRSFRVEQKEEKLMLIPLDDNKKVFSSVDNFYIKDDKKIYIRRDMEIEVPKYAVKAAWLDETVFIYITDSDEEPIEEVPRLISSTGQKFYTALLTVIQNGEKRTFPINTHNSLVKYSVSNGCLLQLTSNGFQQIILS